MRLPDWVKTKYNPSALGATNKILKEYGLSTVCEEARCPNRSKCFSKPTATFMILGSRCTRNCGFCSVNPGLPEAVNRDEPFRVALASERMGLRHVVITSVTRDDLPDGGAGHFALTIRAIREKLPEAKIEVLTPDFKGDEDALRTVLAACPDVFNHNVETVPSLYSKVRPGADYRRSLDVLRKAKLIAPDVSTKSGIMLGLGESFEEVSGVLRALREAGCDFLTVGQYLQPSKKCLPVVKYVEPPVFKEIEREAMEMGFTGVSSAPLARSSMDAGEMFLKGK